MLEWLETHQLPCLFRQLYGMACPGCGFQRAVVSMLKGEFADSFFSWPALLPLIVFLLLILGRVSGIRKISRTLLKSMGFVCLIMILISYLFKLFINTQ